jgi:hypothetical protein
MDAQPPRWRGGDLAHLVDDFVGTTDEIDAILQEGLTQFRQPDTACVAMEKWCTDKGFKLLDACRDYGPRTAHLACSLSEALRFGDTHEGVYGKETVHRRLV